MNGLEKDKFIEDTTEAIMEMLFYSGGDDRTMDTSEIDALGISLSQVISQFIVHSSFHMADSNGKAEHDFLIAKNFILEYIDIALEQLIKTSIPADYEKLYKKHDN